LSRWFGSSAKSALMVLAFLFAYCVSGGPLMAQIHALPPNMAVESSQLKSRLVVDYDAEACDPCGPDVCRGVGVQQWEDDCWYWQVLPEGLMYPAYLAGGRESRIGSNWVYERRQGWLWDMSVGGHVGLLRRGSSGAIMPQGWQLDIEGAAFPRLDPEDHRNLVSADFRVGVPLTVRSGRWEGKLAYYHLSSHLGDEYMATHNTLDRINYSRDAFVLGVAFRPRPSVRFYGEAGWAFYTDGGSRPWEFQFGIDCSSPFPTTAMGLPFFAINGRIRQEVDYGGNMTVEAGWQWRGRSGKLMRIGLHYFNGMSDQAQFFRQFESQLGMGAWLDY
jgi:hypothetical protein